MACHARNSLASEGKQAALGLKMISWLRTMATFYQALMASERWTHTKGESVNTFMLPSSPASSVVNAQFLSHGTIACRDLAKSRRFYEEFLGLDVVHLTKLAMALRLNTNVYIACVCIDNKAPENTMWSHFGLNVRSREEVDRIHGEAVRLKDDYELRTIGKPQMLHGAYQFYLQDRDTNWWEIQYEPRSISDLFSTPDLDSNHSQASPDNGEPC